MCLAFPTITDLNADEVTFGYLLTTFSAVQLVGGPIIGRACDVYGYLFALQVRHGTRPFKAGVVTQRRRPLQAHTIFVYSDVHTIGREEGVPVLKALLLGPTGGKPQR